MLLHYSTTNDGELETLSGINNDGSPECGRWADADGGNSAAQMTITWNGYGVAFLTLQP
jgi:hypothetical protein